LDSRLVLWGVQRRVDAHACLGACRPDQADDRLVTDERLPLPVQTDEGKHAVLNLVPLAGAWGVVAHGPFQAELVGEVVRMVFPGPVTSSVTSSPVGTQQQTPGLR